MKAEGRGAIAAFAPSGLSLDGPAHQYHRALMAELTSGSHERLGDAVVAAQTTYAQTGLMPELVSLYHLFGDPAMPFASGGAGGAQPPVRSVQRRPGRAPAGPPPGNEPRANGRLRTPGTGPDG